MSYITELLSTAHHKEAFSCGNEMLDNYLHKQAKQDVKRKLSACFVLSKDGKVVEGYYTLSSSSIPGNLLPESIKKKLPPSYKDLPVTLLGRLAVGNFSKGQGAGKLLLIDALRRSYDATTNVASMAVVVDPIDHNAINFYNKFGFIALPESGKMFLPMLAIEQLFHHQ